MTVAENDDASEKQRTITDLHSQLAKL